MVCLLCLDLSSCKTHGERHRTDLFLLYFTMVLFLEDLVFHLSFVREVYMLQICASYTLKCLLGWFLFFWHDG